MKTSMRVTALFATAALLATGCASRLSEEEIAFYAGQQADGPVAGSVTQSGSGSGGTGGSGAAGGGTSTGGAQGVASGETATTAPGTDGAAGGTDGGAATGAGAGGQGTTDTGGSADGGADAGTGTADGGQTGGSGGSGDTGGDGSGGGGGGGGGQAQQPTDTRAAPPGGNGGATDVGVTETEIVVYNVVDRTGAVQGLFEDAYDAVRAYFTMFAQTEGTVYGRQFVFEDRDAQMSTQANRSAYLDACENGFAGVGSMSAFEHGAAGPINDCGIPDVRTAAVHPDIQTLPSVVSVDAMKPGLVPLSEWSFYKERYPEAITKAGYLYIDNGTTEFQTTQNRQATTQGLGYDWIVNRPISLSEVNYAAIIQELKSEGVEFVAFQGAESQAARLAKAMQEQDYAPAAFALQSNTYKPELIELCEGACDDFVFVAQTGALVEEIDSNPEMQTYRQWLQAIKPGARPTGLGMYAWSAARAFVQAVKNAGPELTREKLLEEMDALSGDTGNGLMPPQNYDTQVPTDCVIMLEISGGAFHRVDPAQGFRCRDNPHRIQ